MGDSVWALAVVFGLLGVVHLALRWFGARRNDVRQELRVVSTCGIGARKSLHVVEIDGVRLLLAASEAGVTLLHTLPEAVSETEAESAEASPRHEAPAPRPRAASGLYAGAATLLVSLAVLTIAPSPAYAVPSDAPAGVVLSLDGISGAGGSSSALEMLALLTILSVAPSILLMATCFTRVVIVLAFVRQALGVQHLPPNQVLVGLAMFVTFYVMSPIGVEIRDNAYEPYTREEISIEQAGERAIAPLRKFMMHHTREADLGLFVEMSGEVAPETLEDVSTSTLLPAFLISELRTAFEIGFVIFLPFLVIDLVVSSMLISMGMIVLPPMVVALPFKIMLFVLADGWNLVLGSVVAGLR